MGKEFMFKEKSTKKRIVTSESSKDHSTLDARHQQMVSSLQDKQARVASWEEERDQLQTQLSDLQHRIQEMKGSGDYDTPKYNSLWTSNIQCIESLREVEDVLLRQTTCEEELEYYENTGYILFQYYDCLRNQGTALETPLSPSQMPPTPNPPRTGKGRKKPTAAPTRSILDAFQGAPPVAPPPAAPTEAAASSSSSDPRPLDKSTLVDEYLAYMDTNQLRPIQADALCVCIRCQIELVCMQQEGSMVCPLCGYQELLLIEQNRPLMRQMNKEASHQSYKRINHFREWCSQVQGRESTDIPEAVFEQILQEIKKEKITDPKKITYNKMREILKRLRINKYYEHIQYLIRRICNVQTPHFPPELEDKLCSMFKEIQGSFVKHCPPCRKNFLSYSYVLFKFFQILGQQDAQYLSYCRHFMLLKSREKLYVQDQIFKAICEDLGWPVIPTL